MTTEAETLTGRALDIAVARAIGYTVVSEEISNETNSPYLAYRLFAPGGADSPLSSRWTIEACAWDDVPEMSTSWDAAALVVAAMRGRGYSPYLSAYHEGKWTACFENMDYYPKGLWEAIAETLPEAICRAALKALAYAGRALAAEQEAGQ